MRAHAADNVVVEIVALHNYDSMIIPLPSSAESRGSEEGVLVRSPSSAAAQKEFKKNEKKKEKERRKEKEKKKEEA